MFWHGLPSRFCRFVPSWASARKGIRTSSSAFRGESTIAHVRGEEFLSPCFFCSYIVCRFCCRGPYVVQCNGSLWKAHRQVPPLSGTFVPDHRPTIAQTVASSLLAVNASVAGSYCSDRIFTTRPLLSRTSWSVTLIPARSCTSLSCRQVARPASTTLLPEHQNRDIDIRKDMHTHVVLSGGTIILLLAPKRFRRSGQIANISTRVFSDGAPTSGLFDPNVSESTGVTSVEDSPVEVQGTTLLGQRHSTSVSLATAARSPLPLAGAR